jgi:hypothetical protein
LKPGCSLDQISGHCGIPSLVSSWPDREAIDHRPPAPPCRKSLLARFALGATVDLALLAFLARETPLAGFHYAATHRVQRPFMALPRE